MIDIYKSSLQPSQKNKNRLLKKYEYYWMMRVQMVREMIQNVKIIDIGDLWPIANANKNHLDVMLVFLAFCDCFGNILRHHLLKSIN